ncbi:MAG: hypothetical protein ACJ77K_01420 [Bacteroidia bacterium]
MKKYITLFALMLASLGFVNAQTAALGTKEKITSRKHVKLHSSHFEKMKPDKRMAHNSTKAFKEVRIRQCHPDGYSMRYTSPAKMNSRSWKKVKNKTFGTYTMK